MTASDAIALAVVEACESAGADHMITGAFAFNHYGIPRSTKDFDVVVDGSVPGGLDSIMKRLQGRVEFADQVQFDTLTWGRRHIGRCEEFPGFVVELFELFDDPFVKEQFQRRVRLLSSQLGRAIWLPTAEDVVVQKLRWGRAKDLEDARDVLAVQDPATLDMAYVRRWCGLHGTEGRLDAILDSIPPM